MNDRHPESLRGLTVDTTFFQQQLVVHRSNRRTCDG